MNLPSYNVPIDILNIEQGKNAKKGFTKKFKKQIANYRTNESKYYVAYKTMLYFEEAAHGNLLSQYNQVNIELRFSPDSDKFYIKNDVCFH